MGRFGGEHKEFSLGNVDGMASRRPVYVLCMLSRHTCFY